MIHNVQSLLAREYVVQQGLNKIEQMINLLEFAAWVLIDFAIGRQYVQGFE